MPLAELWNQEGPLDARRSGDVGEGQITGLLRNGSTFVVAEVGQPLRWILDGDRFGFGRQR